MFGVNKFYDYLVGQHFTLQTDHKALLRIFGNKKELPKIAASRLIRWSVLLSSFNYTIEYKTGKEMEPVDTLSRLPLPTTEGSFLETGSNIY